MYQYPGVFEPVDVREAHPDAYQFPDASNVMRHIPPLLQFEGRVTLLRFSFFPVYRLHYTEINIVYLSADIEIRAVDRNIAARSIRKGIRGRKKVQNIALSSTRDAINQYDAALSATRPETTYDEVVVLPELLLVFSELSLHAAKASMIIHNTNNGILVCIGYTSTF